MTPTQTTDVLGYYNPNPFPIVLNVSEIGQAINLAPGKFIEDQAGNKINDPVFKGYCRPQCLSLELSNSPVPLRIVARPEQSNNGPYSFSQSEQFVTDSRGNIISANMPPINFQPATNQNSITEMTIEQAIKLKLIRPPGRMVEDDSRAPAETETGMSSDVPIDLPTPGLNVEEVNINKIALKQLEKAGVIQESAAPQPIISKLSSDQTVVEPILNAPKAEAIKPRQKRGQKKMAPQALPTKEVQLPEPEV